MTSHFDDIMANTSLGFTSTDMTSMNIHSAYSDLQTGVHDEPTPEGCVEIRFSQMEFLPWKNSENIVSEDVEKYTRKVRLFLLQILFLIGGPANVINMAVFYKHGLQDRVNLLLFSLSLADELFLVTAMLNYSEEFYLEITGEGKIGPMFTFMMNNHLNGFQGFCYVSFILSAIIACERCYCVLLPLKYHTLLRTRTTAFIIIAIYIIVLGLYFIAAVKYHVACVYDPDSGVVFSMLSHSEIYGRYKNLIDYMDNIFFGAGLPSGMKIVVLTATMVTTSKLQRSVAWRAETSSSISPREVALTKMLIGTSLLLIACISPSCLFRIACLLLPEMNVGGRNQNFYLTCLWVTEVFLYINSTFNIFVYYMMGSRYRETFWTLFNKKKVEKNEIMRKG